MMILCNNDDCVIANACFRNQEYQYFKTEPMVSTDSVVRFESTEEGECKHYIQNIVPRDEDILPESGS